MTERERFIEIICEGLAQNCGGNCTLPNKMYCQNCHIVADYLLKNGVIVPQCKVGDTVYETDGIRIYELTILDISLHKNKPYYKTDGVDFDDDAIGKSIFLTKEEAEKALKGGAE